MTLAQRRSWIEPETLLTIEAQCKILGVPRSSYYYEPAPPNPFDLSVMRRVDEIYTERPFYGSRKITKVMQLEEWPVNRKRIQGAMQTLGIMGNVPGPMTSKSCPEHIKYPYLLRGFSVVRPLQVWSTDITYIRLRDGFIYLTAVIDWFSRKVIAWELSNSLDGAFCLRSYGRLSSTEFRKSSTRIKAHNTRHRSLWI